MKKPAKGGKRRTSKGKFVVPTPEEIINDRSQHIDNTIQETVIDGDKLKKSMLNINYHEALIKFRQQQLGYNDKFEQTEMLDIREQYDGATKTEELLRAELDVDLYNYRTQIREFEKLKDKFVIKYKFSKEQVEQVLKDSFNWSDWTKKTKVEKLDKEIHTK